MKQILACLCHFAFAVTFCKELCSEHIDTKIYFKEGYIDVCSRCSLHCIHVEKALSKNGTVWLHIFAFSGSRTWLLCICCVRVPLLCLWKSNTLLLCSSLLSLVKSIVTQRRIKMYLHFQTVTQILSPSSIGTGMCTENILSFQGLAGSARYEKWWCLLH